MFSRLFAILLLTGLLAVTPSHAASLREAFIPANPPKPAPPLSFENDKGGAFNLHDFKGRYVLLNLWATWCGPCAHEMPSLDRLYQKLDAKTMAVIALTEDHDGRSVAEAFFTRHNLHHLPIYVDASGQVPSLVHARGMPTTILIDPNGFELGRVEGETDWSTPEALSFLQEKIRR